MGGKLTKSEWTGEMVWSCEGCTWVHKPNIAKRVLTELLGAARTIDKISRKELNHIRLKILKGGSSCH